MFKNEKGLTLIELLITISVLAVVSAIALPVINNVVASSNSNAATQTQSDVTDFITKYNAAGETLVSTDGRTLQGFVDTDGDNTIDQNELVDTLTIDSKFSFSAAGTSDTVGGTYTADGITGATTGLASAGGSTAAPAISGNKYVTGTDFSATTFYGQPGGSALGYISVQSPSTVMMMDASYGATWAVDVKNGSQTFSYTVYNYSNGSNVYFSPDWASISNANPSASTVLPNFTYNVSEIYLDPVVQKVTIVLG